LAPVPGPITADIQGRLLLSLIDIAAGVVAIVWLSQ
jgi:hypothetical protein